MQSGGGAFHQFVAGRGIFVAFPAQAVLRSVPDEAPFRVWWREAGEIRERHPPLGTLKREEREIVHGQKIGYGVDTRHSRENRDRIVDLVRGAGTLFIEAAFARGDREQAADRCHLTTEQPGRIARRPVFGA